MLSISTSQKHCCMVESSPYPKQALVFMCVLHAYVQVFENTKGKEEIARNKQFLFFQKCFLLI